MGCYIGLEKDLLSLTYSSSGGKALHKAMILLSASQEMSKSVHLNNNITNLNHITHFDASFCQLLSGHLEQLAMACPNLLDLNLRRNVDCLKSLQGLCAISACCKELQGLSLKEISVVEYHVHLWKILIDLKFTYLAIELCVLVPHEKGKQTVKTVFNLHKQCLSLKALEFEYIYGSCTTKGGCGELFLLSSFTSLVHILANDIKDQPTAIQDIVSSCKMLKYLKFTSNSFDTSRSLVVNCNLEQLCIELPFTSIPSTFMESISAHGGLVHVFLCFYSVTADGITYFIENSLKLLTCQIYAQHIYNSLGIPLNLLDFKMTLKKKFSSRKLFSCGSYRLARKQSFWSVTTQISLHCGLILPFVGIGNNDNCLLCSLFQVCNHRRAI